ncbi:hypothetical protein ABG768_014650 [Culter alburnus]|uniref:Uncharacterized protein n=1 Tax=Culter alburnus TaxID=194366 RepID=A0AAW1ZAA5_CULAL
MRSALGSAWSSQCGDSGAEYGVRRDDFNKPRPPNPGRRLDRAGKPAAAALSMVLKYSGRSMNAVRGAETQKPLDERCPWC